MVRKIVISIIICIGTIQILSAQEKQETKKVTVNFTDKEIYIGEAKCFGYTKKGNDFIITDSNGKEIIKGTIRKNLMGSFESVIIFMESGKAFTNKKIVGRNDLIFALVNNKVILPDCRIDADKLKKFIQENDGK